MGDPPSSAAAPDEPACGECVREGGGGGHLSGSSVGEILDLGPSGQRPRTTRALSGPRFGGRSWTSQGDPPLAGVRTSLPWGLFEHVRQTDRVESAEEIPLFDPIGDGGGPVFGEANGHFVLRGGTIGGAGDNRVVALCGRFAGHEVSAEIAYY